jgi:hypothetical protein
VNTTRFQHLYIKLDEMFRFDCDEEDLARQLRLRNRDFEGVTELSYRDPEGFAMWMAFLAYQQLLSYGGCDDDGFVDFAQMEAASVKLAQQYLQRRGEQLLPSPLDRTMLATPDFDAVVSAIAHDASLDLLPGGA